MMTWNNLVITIDVDWAPDFIIDQVAQLLTSYGVKSTWFVTHESYAIDRLRERPELFELGIHPNFLPGSSHGETPDDVLTKMMEIVPDAVSSRSHAVMHSGRILSGIMKHTNVKIDSTFFLPELEGIQPVIHEMDNGWVMKAPFFWADDYEMGKANPDWNIDRFYTMNGLKILMFHPIHLFLNSPAIQFYNDFRVKQLNSNIKMESEFSRYKHEGTGAMNSFLSVLSQLENKEDSIQLKDLIKDIK